MQERAACLKHSDFFKVNDPSPSTAQLRAAESSERKGRAQPVHTHRQTGSHAPKSDYERFNCNNFNIRYWSWNYRGCWHQTCPPIDPREGDVNCTHSNYKTKMALYCYFLSLPPCVRIRAIYAPAAFLGCGSHFSGSLSGIEP